MVLVGKRKSIVMLVRRGRLRPLRPRNVSCEKDAEGGGWQRIRVLVAPFVREKAKWYVDILYI